MTQEISEEQAKREYDQLSPKQKEILDWQADQLLPIIRKILDEHSEMTEMKQTFQKRDHANLVQSIRMAKSLEEIDGLLALGASFEHAGKKTHSRWHEAAKKRKAELLEQ